MWEKNTIRIFFSFLVAVLVRAWPRAHTNRRTVLGSGLLKSCLLGHTSVHICKEKNDESTLELLPRTTCHYLGAFQSYIVKNTAEGTDKL